MSDALLEVRGVALDGEWHGVVVRGVARLQLAADAVQVLVDERELRATYSVLTGTEWRSNELTIHAPAGALTLSGESALGEAWVALQARACPLPELTNGLRGLGSRRGGDLVLQERFFAPLLQARRRLEEQREIEWRLAAFDAGALRQQVEETLRTFAVERHATRPPARRALEAWLLDEAEGLLSALDVLDVAARALREAPDSRRFAAWREWTRRARGVFEQADRCWVASFPLLGAPPPLRGRGMKAGGGLLPLLAFALRGGGWA